MAQSITISSQAQAITVESPTFRFRIKRGSAGSVMPASLGLQQAWECITGNVRRVEWRDVDVVGNEASDHE